MTDFSSDYGKAAPRLACPRGFDRRVKRQQVGLPGDIADQVDNAVDFPSAANQMIDYLLQCIDARLHDPRLLLQMGDLLTIVDG